MTDNCPRTTFYLFRLGNLLIEVSKSPETKIREGAFKALFESLEHHRIKRGRRKCFGGFKLEVQQLVDGTVTAS
jgi:hypothetical protein